MRVAAPGSSALPFPERGVVSYASHVWVIVG